MKKVALIQLVLTLMVFFHLKSELISVQVDTKINSARHDIADEYVYKIMARALIGKCVYNSEKDLEFELMRGPDREYHIWPRELKCKGTECKVYSKEMRKIFGHTNAVVDFLSEGELIHCNLGLLTANEKRKALEN